MKHRFLRHISSRGWQAAINAALKALGLDRPTSCLPYEGDTDALVLAPAPFPDAVSSPSPHPRRILYLSHRFYPEAMGGTEYFLARLATAQLALGNHVRIISFSTGFPWEYPEKMAGMLMRRETWQGIEVVAIRYRNPPAGLYYEQINDLDLIQQHFAQHYLNLFQPDLIHAIYPQPFASFLRVCREKSLPYLVTATDFTMLCPKGTLTEGTNQACHGSLEGRRCPDASMRFKQAERLISGAIFFTVPSKFSARQFARELPNLQTLVIPHDVEAIFKATRQRTEVRCFAFFGNLNWAKGVFLSVKAFHKLDGDVTLDIYGDGPLRPILGLYCLFDRRIRLHGQVLRETLPAYYNRADCVIIPSQTAETYSLVASEAAASGCMIVVSDLGALTERAQALGCPVFRSGNFNHLHQALKDAVNAPIFPGNITTALTNENESYEILYRKAVEK